MKSKKIGYIVMNCNKIGYVVILFTYIALILLQYAFSVTMTIIHPPDIHSLLFIADLLLCLSGSIIDWIVTILTLRYTPCYLNDPAEKKLSYMALRQKIATIVICNIIQLIFLVTDQTVMRLSLPTNVSLIFWVIMSTQYWCDTTKSQDNLDNYVMFGTDLERTDR
jgi:hypothetical protein